MNATFVVIICSFYKTRAKNNNEHTPSFFFFFYIEKDNDEPPHSLLSSATQGKHKKTQKKMTSFPTRCRPLQPKKKTLMLVFLGLQETTMNLLT